MSKLTQSFVRTIEKPGSYHDERGLILRVSSLGAKKWVLRYQLNNRRHDLGLGSFPAVSLKAARLAVDTHRLDLSQGIDPLSKRALLDNPPTLQTSTVVTFRIEAERYIKTHRQSWKNARHAQQWSHSLRDHVYPILGDMPVANVDTEHVLDVLAPIWTQIPETAFRLRNRVELVLDAAKARKLREGENPARWRGHLDKLLPRQKHSKMPFSAMPAEQLGPFVRLLDSLATTAARACELLIYTACRSSEVCDARWSEFDLTSGLWTIDAARMKAGKTQVYRFVRVLSRFWNSNKASIRCMFSLTPGSPQVCRAMHFGESCSSCRPANSCLMVSAPHSGLGQPRTRFSPGRFVKWPWHTPWRIKSRPPTTGAIC